MNYKFINVLMFAAGAAIGSAVTWKVVKTKYERIAQEEIESVKETFADRFSNPEETAETKECPGQINWAEFEDLEEDDVDPDSNARDLQEYRRLTANYTGEKGGAEHMTNDTVPAPYVIGPFDFGELDGYSQIELTYYADGVLEDDEYNIVNDIDTLIGPKALTSFGEYEDDAVFVRNERLRTDFQILMDYRTYAQARSISPDVVDDE